jgi:hypothetical protein
LVFVIQNVAVKNGEAGEVEKPTADPVGLALVDVERVAPYVQGRRVALCVSVRNDLERVDVDMKRV